LIFVPSNERIGKDLEKRVYDQHENHPDNDGYLAFQDQILMPLSQRLPRGGKVLDYGSGPNPVLASRLSQLGYDVSIFDLYYANFPEVLEGFNIYDGVTSVEVVEHICDLRAIMKLWDGLVCSGGWIGIMTLLWSESRDFSKWWYPRDPTHITFLSEKTIEYISGHWSWNLVFQTDRTVLWQKSR
jgi:hypothetical protein